MVKKLNKRGRPRKSVPEKIYFGITCTEAEKTKVVRLINKEGLKKGERITISDYFLRQAGVR